MKRKRPVAMKRKESSRKKLAEILPPVHRTMAHPSGGSGACLPAVEIITPTPPRGFEGKESSVLSGAQLVRFNYFEPAAEEIFVVGNFNDWNPRATPLARKSPDHWTVDLTLPPGEYRYRLVVDGVWRNDPAAPQTASNPYGDLDAVFTVEGIATDEN